MTEDDVRNLAREELDGYCLPHWNFRFNKSKVNSGLCDYSTKTIYLSKCYLPHMSPEEIRQTLLHEIAHALTPWAKHGRKWKLACEYLGIPPNVTGSIPRLPGKYSAKCSCGNVWNRYNSKCTDPNNKKMCGVCFDYLIFTKDAQ